MKLECFLLVDAKIAFYIKIQKGILFVLLLLLNITCTEFANYQLGSPKLSTLTPECVRRDKDKLQTNKESSFLIIFQSETVG